MRQKINQAIKFFIEGVLIVLPFALTFMLSLWGLRKSQNLVKTIFSSIIPLFPALSWINSLPFLDIAIIVIFLTFLGYIGSNLFIQSLVKLFEQLIMKVPIANMLYSYIKDSTSSLMNKFGEPVLVTVNKNLDIKKVGFVTQECIKKIEAIKEKVLVYFPNSYAFSGEMVFINSKYVEKMPIATADALRLILSGGLCNFEEMILLGEKKKLAQLEEKK